MIGQIVTDVLLGLATLTVVLSSIGIAVMPGAAAKLHYVAPAAVVAPVLVTLAVLVREGLDSSTGMTFIALIFLVAVTPFLSHATIRAIRARSANDLGDPLPPMVADKPSTGER